MGDRLYVSRGQKKVGPFSSSQLRSFAIAGRLLVTDTVWKEGMEKGVLASRVKNLFPLPPARQKSPKADLLSQVSGIFPAAASVLLADPEEIKKSDLLASEVLVQPEESVPAPIDPVVPLASSPAEQAPPKKALSVPVYVPPRKRRAIALKGVVILSQDGRTVHFRKKCAKCGLEEPSRSTMPIGTGVTRMTFYCRKCGKSQEVQIQGMMH